jgi:hypothetical protein
VAEEFVVVVPDPAPGSVGSGGTPGCRHLFVSRSARLIAWPLAFSQRKRTKPR